MALRGTLGASKENNVKEHTLIYIPRAYLPEDTEAIGFIFNDENEERPRQWKRAHVERCSKGQYRVIEAVARLAGTTKAGAVKYLLLSRQDGF